jgi:hypothetical protein
MSMSAILYHSAETVRQFPDEGNRAIELMELFSL